MEDKMGTVSRREVWREKPLIETAPSYETLSLLLDKPQKMTIEKVVKRFLAKVKMPPEGFGCWIWKGARNPAGYGLFSINNRYALAHRVSFLLKYGRPIARDSVAISGLYVMHTCDNPPCVNPYHLNLGDARENNADMDQKGRARRLGSNGENWGRKNGQAKLFPDEVKEIRYLCALEGRMSYAKIGKMYGVHTETVRDIHIGKIWRRLR